MLQVTSSKDGLYFSENDNVKGNFSVRRDTDLEKKQKYLQNGRERYRHDCGVDLNRKIVQEICPVTDREKVQYGHLANV